MNRKHIPFPLLILLFAAHSGTAQMPTCSDLKNGVFIYFSPADGSRQTYTRNGDMQKQVNPTTHETTIWDLEWVSDCAYLLTYNSGMEDRPKSTQQLLKKHKFFCQITAVTDDYYVVQTGLDKVANPVVETDTKCRNQETSITINIKPGNKYYLRCEIPWSLSPKPKLTEVKKEEADALQKTFLEKAKFSVAQIIQFALLPG